MKRLRVLMLASLVFGLLSSTVVQAHHSFSQFDRGIQVVVTAEVVRWAFNNPHSWLYVNV